MMKISIWKIPYGYLTLPFGWLEKDPTDIEVRICSELFVSR